MTALIAANWKMNASLAGNEALLSALAAGMASKPACDVALCIPAPYLAQFVALMSQLPALAGVALGAQDVSSQPSGAFTGEVSAAMLKDFGCRYAIVGHSERRQYHGETDALVAAKAQQALAQGITPIVCVGETLAERDAGRTTEVVKRQLAAVIQANGHCISEIVVATSRSGRSAPARRPALRMLRRCMRCCVRNWPLPVPTPAASRSFMAAA